MDHAKAVEVGVNFFVVVKAPGDVVVWVVQFECECQVNCNSCFHVDGSATPNTLTSVDGALFTGKVARNGDCVEVPSDDDSTVLSQVGARDNVIADARHCEVGGLREQVLNGVCEFAFVPAD